MFIKLTRPDQTPIWLNAAFIVTVEPRRGGGATVVPVGDGLDYDVCESPEAVLAMLVDAPTPAILPIPNKDALTPTPDDVSPEEDVRTEEIKEQPAEEPVERPVKKSRKSTTVKKPRVSRKKKPALVMSAEQVERLRKMAPKTLKKLQNTLKTQFKVGDVDEAVASLAANEIFALQQEHVLWKGAEEGSADK